MSDLVPAGRIEQAILLIRGQKELLDADLTDLYWVEIKALVGAVKRNAERFPADFMFQLSPEEVRRLRCQIGTSKPGRGGRRYAPTPSPDMAWPPRPVSCATSARFGLAIWNPGGLPAPLTPEDLLRDHDSIPRNPKIAAASFFAGLVEQWGTGTIRMAAALKEAGHSGPEFDARTVGRFRVILRQGPAVEARLKGMGLNNRQVQLIAYVREHGKITNRAYRELTGLSDEAARKEIAGLLDLGLLEQGGEGRSTAYVLKKRVGD